MNSSKATRSFRMLFLSLFLPFMLEAQDIHFSQFGNVPMHLSPALTGVFNGDLRFNANYRSQWYDVPITYRTAYFAGDMKFYTCEKRSHFFAAGLIFDYDWAGDGNLSTGRLALSGSYTRQMSKKNFISIGVQLSAFQRSFDSANLRFDEQWNGKFYNPDLSNRENFISESTFYGDISAGLNWHYQNTGKSRTRWDLGFGVFHLNTPNKSFWDEKDVNLPARYALYGRGNFQLANTLDGVLLAIGGFQGPHREYLVGIGLKKHLRQTRTKELALLFGLSYRFNGEGIGVGDAIIPNVEMRHKAWNFGLSYDINISDFNIATNNFGGPEFSVIYTFRKPDVEFCATCPTYL